MCFSASMSLFSLVAGITGSTMVYQLGTYPDKILAVVYGFVALMQVIDYLLWNHPVCDTYNRIVSIAGMVLNHLQPVVLFLSILVFNPDLPDVNLVMICIAMAIYLCIMIPYSAEFLKHPEKECSIKNNEDHMHWNWNYMPYFRYAYTTYLLTNGCLWYYGLALKSHINTRMDPSRAWYSYKTGEPQLEGVHLYPAFGSICALSSFFMYFTTRYVYSVNNVGNIWCFYTVFIPLIYYVLRKTIVSIV